MSPSNDLIVGGGVAIVAALLVLLLSRHREAPAADAAEPDFTLPPLAAPVYSPRALSRAQRLVADTIVNECQAAGVHPSFPAFMLALALTESSFRPTVIGDDGLSLGLFQLQVSTARDHRADVTQDDLLRTDTNVSIAILEMRRLLRVYPGFTWGDYAEAWTLGGRGRFVLGRRNPTKVQRMHEAITTLDLHLSLNEVPA